MNDLTFPAGSVIRTLLPLAAMAATANGAAIDVQKYRGAAMAMLICAAPSAGTNPTLAVKLQHAQDADKVTRAGITYAGTGNGRIDVEAGPDPVAEDITFTASSATEFAVVGSVSGALGTLTVGTWFECAQIRAYIAAGATAFVSTDVFTVPTTARTWADLVSFTGLTSAALNEKKVLKLDSAGRYLRAVKTIGGTNSPSYTGALVLIASE